MSAAEGNPKPRMISLRKVNEDLEMTEARAKRKREDDEAVGEDSELAAPREKKPVHENVPLDAGDVKPEFDFSSVSVGRNIVGCRSVDHYHNAGRIGDGTYGVVYKAQDSETNQIVALKKIKMEIEREGFPLTSLREVKTLMQCQHPNIVGCKEIVAGSDLSSVFIVMEYVDHDLKALMDDMGSKRFTMGQVKCLMRQLLSAVEYLHDNWVVHRDIKTSNLLFNNRGILKLCDFGLAREYSSPIRPMTQMVVTLWYRAPELLLGATVYGPAIDIWSVGCVFAELLNGKPLFDGHGELEQLNKMFQILGTVKPAIWPDVVKLSNFQKVTFKDHPYNRLKQHFPMLSDAGFDLLNRMLTYDPSRRITAREALEHRWFNESPFPVDPDMMPTWPSRSEGRPRARNQESEEASEALRNVPHGVSGN